MMVDIRDLLDDALATGERLAASEGPRYTLRECQLDALVPVVEAYAFGGSRGARFSVANQHKPAHDPRCQCGHVQTEHGLWTDGNTTRTPCGRCPCWNFLVADFSPDHPCKHDWRWDEQIHQNKCAKCGIVTTEAGQHVGPDFTPGDEAKAQWSTVNVRNYPTTGVTLCACGHPRDRHSGWRHHLDGRQTDLPCQECADCDAFEALPPSAVSTDTKTAIREAVMGWAMLHDVKGGRLETETLISAVEGLFITEDEARALLAAKGKVRKSEEI